MFLDKLKSGIAILIVCLGVLFAGGGLAIGLRASTAPEADPLATDKASERPPVATAQRDKDKPVAAEARVVAVSHPAQRQAAPYGDFAGRLEALRSVEVRATASGFVEKVCFQAGADVQKGDVLFLLDSRAPRLALDKAKAELTLAELRKEQSNKELARHVS